MSQISAGKRLLVLGGGVSGLSYVHYLRNFLAFYKKTTCLSKITLIESNNYMGGSIKTNVFDDGVVHELGPRSVRAVGHQGRNTVVLLEQLGLASHILSVNKLSAAGKFRYIYKDGQMYRVPSSLLHLFMKIPGGKERLYQSIKHDFFTPKMNLEHYPHQDPSLYDFVAYRFGQETAEAVMDPLLRGITAGDARKLSAKALFGDMVHAEQVRGSVLKGILKPISGDKLIHDELFRDDCLQSQLVDKFSKEETGAYNLKTGLQSLPERLSNSILNTNDDGLVSIYNQTKVESIEFNKRTSTEAPCSIVVSTVDGDRIKIEADHIVSTIPAKNFAQILPTTMLPEQKLALENVYKIPHVPVGCVVVEYRNLSKELPAYMNSFGFLAHSSSGTKLLGVSFDSAIFPEVDKQVGSLRMTCMMGGAWAEEVFGTDDMDKVTDRQLEEIALQEIRSIMKIPDEPYRMSSFLWKTGIAQYTPGHIERLKEMRNSISSLGLPLTLLGQSYDGISVNDVIFSARVAASKYVMSL